MSLVKADQLQENTADNGIEILSTLRLDDATNPRMGTATLVGGTVDVANTSVTADTRVYLSRKTQGAGPGHLSYVLTAGVKFAITSSSGTDNADIAWVLVEPI